MTETFSTPSAWTGGPVAAPIAAEASPVEFVGARSQFLRLLWRGTLLELVTLGFYRFWLATDMRRHMWGHTAVGGDALEYTGTGKELLIGFLVALAILMPIYLAYFFIGLEAERLQQFASIPLVLFFYLFAQFAFYRARRYRLTRTVWRGVRFWMIGSGLSYAWRAGLWALLSAVTIGIATPWAAASLERYKLRHSYYGNLQGRFDGTGWGLFKRYIWLWLVLVPVSAIILAIPVVLSVPGGPALIKPYADPAILAAIVLLGVIAAPFAFAAYKAVEWRWWISGMRFGDVRLESTLPASGLFGLYWKVIGWAALIFTVLGIWIGCAMAFAIVNEHAPDMTPELITEIMQRPSVLIVIGGGYLVAALVFGLIVRMYLRHDLWAKVVSTTVVHNIAAAENVTAEGQAASAIGEGLADSLDIGGF